MDNVQEDCFVVYARADRGRGEWPEHAEQPLAACPTYAEARRIQRSLGLSAHGCVIRYIGPAGGGD
jgi:hypothetical protein